MKVIKVEFQGLKLSVQPHADLEWTLSSKQVAEGYGVQEGTLRRHKQNHTDELVEGKHFITVQNMNGGAPITRWSKRGVIRLGFFIRSERAKLFRDFAEDLVLQKLETVQQPAMRKGRFGSVVGHPLKDRIDQMLSAGVAYAKVSEWCKAQGHPISHGILHAYWMERQSAVRPVQTTLDQITAELGKRSLESLTERELLEYQRSLLQALK